LVTCCFADWQSAERWSRRVPADCQSAIQHSAALPHPNSSSSSFSSFVLDRFGFDYENEDDDEDEKMCAVRDDSKRY
jgi:hypothetical protein